MRCSRCSSNKGITIRTQHSYVRVNSIVRGQWQEKKEQENQHRIVGPYCVNCGLVLPDYQMDEFWDLYVRQYVHGQGMEAYRKEQADGTR
jgi:hypothetical protein